MFHFSRVEFPSPIPFCIMIKDVKCFRFRMPTTKRNMKETHTVSVEPTEQPGLVALVERNWSLVCAVTLTVSVFFLTCCPVKYYLHYLNANHKLCGRNRREQRANAGIFLLLYLVLEEVIAIAVFSGCCNCRCRRCIICAATAIWLDNSKMVYFDVPLCVCVCVHINFDENPYNFSVFHQII